MNDIEVIPVWTGADGWVMHDFGKGALLPPYERDSSLTEATQVSRVHSANPMIRQRPRRHGGGKPRKYDEAAKQQAQAMWNSGVKLRVIVERLQVPHGTVYGWVAGRNGR